MHYILWCVRGPFKMLNKDILDNSQTNNGRDTQHLECASFRTIYLNLVTNILGEVGANQGVSILGPLALELTHHNDLLYHVNCQILYSSNNS